MRLFLFVMKKLRSGYTTGACAAAAAKAAASLLISRCSNKTVNIPFPGGERVEFAIVKSELKDASASCSVIKDAGDDPDVTNGAEIVATARHSSLSRDECGAAVVIKGGVGVGTVTKPGLPVAIGKPAINPVPTRMICEAVTEVLSLSEETRSSVIEISISVPRGEELAQKTLNYRLGIVGGISILGTTGVVKPVSAAAWTATIATSMNVASAADLEEIILSTGRTSERCVNAVLNLPDEALVMMGDYLEFALEETNKHRYKKIHMATMWAKLLKGAMRIPQTHVRHGALDTPKIIHFFRQNQICLPIIDDLESSNTARELLDRLLELDSIDVIEKIARMAQSYYAEIANADVKVHLVHSSGEILCSL